MKVILTTLLLCIVPLGALTAQSRIAQQEQPRGTFYTPKQALQIDTLSWLATNNAAALGLESPKRNGIVSASYNIDEGDYKTAQQAERINAFNLTSYGYVSTKHLHLYGRFSYTQEQQHNRRWSDQTGFLDANPFLTGSDIEGSYTQQLFNSEVTIASKQLFDRLWGGLNIEYTNGDLSRTQDPRSRTQLLDLQLRPSIIFKLNDRNNLGINALYCYTKEKQLKIVSKEENYDRYTYYLMKGVADYSTTSILGFSRRTYSNIYGVNAQYAHTSGIYEWVLSAGWNKRSDTMSEELKYIPGDYTEDEYLAVASMSINNDQHYDQISLSVGSRSGASKTYVQELNTETMPDGIIQSSWKLITSYASYLSSQQASTLTWRHYWLDGETDKDVMMRLHGSISYDQSSFKDLHPASEENFSRVAMSAKWNVRILKKKNLMLYVEPHAATSYSLSDNLILHHATASEENDVIVNNVIMPNHTYHTANRIGGGVNLTLLTNIAGREFMVGAESLFSSSSRLNSHRNHFAIALSMLL